jgi:Sigma-70 region 2
MRLAVSLEAIEALYRERAADFFRFALAKTGDPERARDAVQDGFAHAIRSRATFRGTGSLEAWVVRCVINAAHDLNRAVSRTPAEPDDVVADSVIESDFGAAVCEGQFSGFQPGSGTPSISGTTSTSTTARSPTSSTWRSGRSRRRFTQLATPSGTHCRRYDHE